MSPELKSQVERSPVRPGAEVEPKPEIEKTPETVAEQPTRVEKAKQTEKPGAPAPAATAVVSPGVANRDSVLIQVERELEDGLWDVYREMPDGLRVKFKTEGERVAQVVREGFATGKITARNIITMITDWLKMIPGVNKWFLRQQAKIKTDALIRMHKEQQEK